MDSTIQLPATIMFENEIAKRTPYDGYYATSTGKIVSILEQYDHTNKYNFNNPHLATIKTNRTNYLRARLTIDGEIKDVYVHKIVYETWIGPVNHNGEYNSEYVIDHINSNTLDNSVNNLRLITRSQNSSLINMSRLGNYNPVIMYNVYIDDKFDSKVSGFEMYYRYGISSKDRRRRIANPSKKLSDGHTIRWERV